MANSCECPCNPGYFLGIYLVSEPEVEKWLYRYLFGTGYQMPEVKYEWIIELKYLKKSERDKLAEVKEEGLRQLKQYASSRKFINNDSIKKVLIVFIGKDEYVVYN